MELESTGPDLEVPTYSLTGDLLSYLKCGLQYRYANKGSLPPSKPVQLWFGEFIHAVLEEAYLRWREDDVVGDFPWDWERDIRPIEVEVAKRLSARGLHPNPNVFSRDDNVEPRPIASRRTEAAINTWGRHLFPLISDAEVELRGIREIESSASARADYYEVTGIVDVLGSVELEAADPDNRLIEYLLENEECRTLIQGEAGDQYEIIVDYKGTERPPTDSDAWEHYRWQVLTYSWLRSLQVDASRTVAGMIIFVNELEHSESSFESLADAVDRQATDIMPRGEDAERIRQWRNDPDLGVPDLSDRLKERRSIRLITISPDELAPSLDRFDETVEDIESSVARETKGEGVIEPWRERPRGEGAFTAPERRTCTACDFKHYCPIVREADDVDVGGAPSAP